MNYYPVNPQELIQMIKMGRNPQQLMLSILERQSNTPLGANLYTLAKNGQTAEIEQIARNLAKEQGVDFDSEFKAFKQMLGFR